MTESIKLKLPLIGIEKINNEAKFFHELFWDYSDDKDSNQKIKDRENEIGYYIKFTQRLDKILDMMFPEAARIAEIARSICLSKLIEEIKLPLFYYHFENRIKISKVEKEQWKSAWSNLMYNLGEFKLDEILSVQNENDNEQKDSKENDNEINSKQKIHDRDKNSQLINIEDIVPYIYKLKDNWHVWWANIPQAGDTIKQIWDRITDREVQIISVDDDRYFADLFLGVENSKLLRMNLKHKGDWNPQNLDCGLIWINPGIPYKKEEVQNQIDYIVEKSQKKTLVFVIDLIFKKGEKGKESTVIKGDELIKYLREIGKNVLIIGLTGGTSPFIINSAEKAGADIVVFKNRGGDPENTVAHGSGGSPVGVFDLLWAISWNVSVWRLLEAYKKNYMENNQCEFENIALKFFSNIENASPFWKKYLADWKTQINNEKLNRLFR